MLKEFYSDWVFNVLLNRQKGDMKLIKNSYRFSLILFDFMTKPITIHTLRLSFILFEIVSSS